MYYYPDCRKKRTPRADTPSPYHSGHREGATHHAPYPDSRNQVGHHKQDRIPYATPFSLKEGADFLPTDTEMGARCILAETQAHPFLQETL